MRLRNVRSLEVHSASTSAVGSVSPRIAFTFSAAMSAWAAPSRARTSHGTQVVDVHLHPLFA